MLYPDLNTLHIVRYPDPRLRERTEAVSQIDSFFKELTERMSELMLDAQGIGLAATQVGFPIKFIVLNVGMEPGKSEGYLNPQIIARDGQAYLEEGCLSLPGLFAKVRRAERVKVRATLVSGETIEVNAEGLEARLWQHELDHLEGGLFIDRVGPTKRLFIAGRLREMEEEYAEGKKSEDKSQETE